MRRRLLTAAGVLIACFLLVYAGRSWDERKAYDDQVTFASTAQCFDREMLRRLVEPEQEERSGQSDVLSRCTVTAWTEKSRVRIEDACSRRAYLSDVMLVYGCTGNLIPYGVQLYPEDTAGCLISRDVAERLFGTHNAAGQTLRYGERTWTVRGVFQQPDTLVILEASGMWEEVSFNRLTVRVPSDISPQLAGQRLLTMYGIEGTQIRMDYYDGWHFLRELIPGKWSDFAGWRTNWNTMCENWQQVSRMQKGALERRHISLSKSSAYAGLAGAALLAVTVMCCLKAETDKSVPQRQGWRKSVREILRKLRQGIRRPWKVGRRSCFFRRSRGSDM
ncbi:MAG: ABC transporter permease [Lachnospiraceae bacterium]|nr:ABC transporter permease [Lachnospiraceae bacterium]